MPEGGTQWNIPTSVRGASCFCKSIVSLFLNTHRKKVYSHYLGFYFISTVDDFGVLVADIFISSGGSCVSSPRSRVVVAAALRAELSVELSAARSLAQSCAGTAELAAAAVQNFSSYFCSFPKLTSPLLLWRRWPNFERASAGQVVALFGTYDHCLSHASSCFCFSLLWSWLCFCCCWASPPIETVHDNTCKVNQIRKQTCLVCCFSMSLWGILSDFASLGSDPLTMQPLAYNYIEDS